MADGDNMYFRLRPNDFGNSYTDSGEGDFTEEGTALGLTNPGLLGLFSNPIILGVALPGISRQTLLSADFNGLLTEAEFAVTLDTGDGPADTMLPENIYLPNLNLAIPGVFSVLGGNEQYRVPILGGATVSPLEGFVFSFNLMDAIPDLGALLDLIACIDDPPEGDIMNCITADLIMGAINDALAFPYIGADPVWDGTGAPDIEVSSSSGQFPFNLANADTDYDYLGILAAEIPNRALLPVSIGVVEDGSVDMDAISIQDGDYLALLAATDLISSAFESMNFSIALKYAEDLDDWGAGGVDFDGAVDFLPNYDLGDPPDPTTLYDPVTGEITWALVGDADDKATVDMFMIVYIPTCEPPTDDDIDAIDDDYDDCPVILAQVPGTQRSYQPPVDALGVTPTEADIVVILGIDMPAGFDGDAYNPVGILGQDSLAVNITTNFDILSLLGDL